MNFGSNVGAADGPALMSALPQQIQNAYTRLSLAPGAAADAVERAYAHALKQIDSGSQGEAFGNLRAAYETAVAWARDHEQGTIGAHVDAALAEWLDRLTGIPVAAAMEPMQHEQADFHALLAQALRDERLAAPYAQQALETRIATVLAHDPWQRVELFDAAVACFHWDTDHCAQLADRWTASWIVQACGEALLWRGQAEQDRARQREAIDAVLAHPTPTAALLTRHFFAMDMLMSRYGYWLSLRMPNHILQAWSQAYHAPGFERPAVPKVRSPRTPFKLNARMLIILALLALSVLRIIFYPSTSPSRDWSTAQPQQANAARPDDAAR